VKRSFRSIVAASPDALNMLLKPKILWSSLLCIVFLMSTVVSLTLPDRRAVVVWFPDSRSPDGTALRTELRYVPSGRDVASQAGAVVEELLLGPLGASARPLAIPTARVVSAIRSKKTLYVDVSDEILFGRPSATGVYAAPPLQPRVALGIIERTLRWNFPFYRIVLTVDGKEPSWQPVEVAEEA